jgi:phospholipase C
MIEIGRRRLLQGGAALAASAMTPGMAAAVLGPPAKLSDIDHIVILMKENRSFDHYFGSLSGVRGFDDPSAQRPGGSSIFRQADANNPDGYVLPFRLDTLRTSAQRIHDLSHAWGPQHAAWNGGAMDAWIPAHRAADGARGPLTMGYLTREDLPFYYALADAFTICDGYFCSIFGPTHPNRYYLMTATIDPDGGGGGPALDNTGNAYRWETYPQRLERAGISWRIYHDLDDYGCNVCKYFTQYRDLPPASPLSENALRNRPFYELLWDLRRGNIPQVTWVVPPSMLSEHPDYLPAAGEDHTSQILQALWANPSLWAKTALIVNYDENDGQFDHVVPPTPEPGTPGEFVNGLPIESRVPGAVPGDLAVQPRRICLQPHLRPHLDPAPDRNPLRGRDRQSLKMAARDPRRPHRGVRLRRAGAARRAIAAGDWTRAATGRRAGDDPATPRDPGRPDHAASGAGFPAAPGLIWTP